jgi:hypothetical protein
MVMVYRVAQRLLLVALFVSVWSPTPVDAQQGADAEGLPSIESKTEGMTKIDGFMPVYFDESDGKIWLEIGRWGEDVLHYTSLPAGMGHNDLGLNRGDLGARAVVVFKRVGPKILMEQPNQGFRAESDDVLERKSVDDGFPTSVLWGFTAAAETGDRALVDATTCRAPGASPRIPKWSSRLRSPPTSRAGWCAAWQPRREPSPCGSITPSWSCHPWTAATNRVSPTPVRASTA